MKFRLLPVPHIIIYNFSVYDNETNDVLENHYFLTQKGARRFMLKHCDELSKQNCSCGFGGEPLWFW